VKTEYSEDELPLDPDFATVLLQLKERSKGSELLFTSPVTGRDQRQSNFPIDDKLNSRRDDNDN
jgi:hypothetical protein